MQKCVRVKFSLSLNKGFLYSKELTLQLCFNVAMEKWIRVRGAEIFSKKCNKKASEMSIFCTSQKILGQFMIAAFFAYNKALLEDKKNRPYA